MKLKNYFKKNWLQLMFMLFFFLCSIIRVNAATKTWSGATNTDWNTGTNWGGTIPAAGDIANIPGSLTNYPVINNTVTISTININSAGTGATLTVVSGGTLTASGLITVNANGSFIQSGGTTNAAGFTANNTVTFSGGTMLLTVNLILNNGASMTQSGGLIHMAVNTGTSPTDNLAIATGGTLTQSGGTLHIKDWAAGGGTFNQTGSGALFKIFHDWKPGTGSVFNSTAGTVQFTGSAGGGPDFSSGTRQFADIIIDAGVNPVFGNTASSTLSISGNFTNNNTTLNTSTNATFTFNGSGAQTITSASTGTNATFGNLTINSSSTVSLASSIYIAGNLTITTGTFNEAGNTVTRTVAGGTFSMASGAYLTAGAGIPSNWTTNTFSAGSSIEFNGSGTETIPALNYATLISSNTGARILASIGTIGISETFTPGSNAYTITGSTLNFNGSATQSIPAFNYNNLTSSSTGARTLASSGSIGIAGTFTPGTNTYTITGSTIDYNGSGSQTIAAFDYNNLTSSSSGARTLASAGTIGILGTFTSGSNTYTSTGSTVDFKGSIAQTIPAISYNNLTSSSTGTRTLASSGTIGIAGNFTPGTNTFTVTGSTVDFNGAGAQNIGGITFNNLITSNAGTKSATGNIIVNGTFTVNSPTIFSPGAAYTVAGSGTITGTGTIQVTRTTGTPDLLNQYTISNVAISTLGVDYNGAGAQTVNALNYGNLTISTNATRTVTLANSGTIGISGTFTPTSTTTTYVVTGSTINFNGGGAQSTGAFTFNNLTISNSGTLTTSGSIVMNNTLTIGSSCTLSPAATAIISGPGVLTGTGTLQVTRIAATADFATQYTISTRILTNLTTEYSGLGTQTINNTFGNYSALKISGSGTKSLQGSIFVTGNIWISAGTLDVTASNYGITVGGNWTNDIADANFLERTGVVTFNGNSSVINGIVATQTFYDIIINKTAGQTLSTGGSVTTLAFNNLTQTTGNFTAPSTLTVSADIVLTAGTFTPSSATTIAGNWTNNGATASISGTITFTGTTMTIGGSAATTFPDIIITTGTIALNTSSSCTSLTLANNNVANSLTISTGITLTVNGNVIINQAPGSNVTHAINANSGILTVNGDVTLSVTVNNTSRVVKLALTSGTINITGNLNLNNTLLAANSVVDISGGAGTLNLGGNFNVNTLNTFTIGTSSTVNFNGSGSQTIPAYNYANLTSSGSGARVLQSSGTIGVSGVYSPGSNSFTTTGSTVNFNGTGSQTIPAFNYYNLTGSGARTTNYLTYASSGTIGVAGTFTTAATFTTGGRIITGSTIDFNSSGAQTIPVFSYYNLSNSGNGNRTLSGIIDIAGVFSPTTGIRTITGSTVNYNGADGQTIVAADYNNLTSTNNTRILANGTIRILSTFTPGTSNYTIGTSTVEFNGTTAQAIPVLAVASGSNYYNLKYSGTSIGTLGGNMTFGGDVAVSSGTLYFNNTATNRVFTINGNLTQTGGTIDLGHSTGRADITLLGNLTHTSGTFTTNGSTDKNAYIYFNGTGTQTIAFGNTSSVSFIDFIVNNGATVQLNSTINLNLSNSAVYAGHFTVNSGGTVIFPTGYTIIPSSTASTLPTFTLSAGATMICANASGVNGSVPATNMTRTINSGANYTFNGATGQTPGLVNTTVNNFTANVSGLLNLSASPTINGLLTLTSGTLTIGANTLTLAGTSPVRTLGTIDASNASATLIFTNSSAITLPASIFTGNIKNLTLNGAGGVTLGSAVTIDGALTLTSGILTNSVANLITVSSTGTTSGASGTSYISGPVKKIGNSAFIFPIGKTGTGNQSVAISAPSSATDAFTAEYMRTDPYSFGTTYLQSGLAKVSNCEYWQLDRTTGNSNVTVTLYGNTNSGCMTATGANYFTGSGGLLSDLRVCHYNSATRTWENVGGTTSGTSPNITTVSGTVSTFSPFTFGIIGVAPLPVKLISFTAKLSGANVLLNWSTAMEKNNDHFEIERSSDGINFVKTGEVKGNGNALNVLKYEYIDYNISNETGMVFYYRLKQVDYSGSFEFSSIATVNMVKGNAVTISNITPNPFGNILAISYYSPNADKVSINLIDATGRVLESKTNTAIKGMNKMEFNTEEFAKGLYFINVTSNGFNTNLKMIVKE